MAGGLNAQYFYNRGFDQAKLQEGIFQFLPKHQPGYAPTAAECATTLINRLGRDGRVTDLRYMAYMLATACHESREIKKFQVPQVAKGGKPIIDPKTNLQVTKERSLWTLFNPIDELGQGKGKIYYESVKVLKTNDGALITEKDGDQFKVSNSGELLVSKGMKSEQNIGSISGGAISPNYAKADGVEHQYFGRGLVQLTWWNGYAKSGIAFGYGLD
jgi:hypothetical protein